MDAVGASIGAIGVVTSAVDTTDRELQRHRTKRSDKDDIIIALMGETGSGKSSFIHRITGSDSVKIGHGLESETKSVEAYTVSIDERVITLIDTPGFDDTIRSDVDVLREVSDWLAESYRSQRLLSGIIYLHPITSVRMSGSSHMSLRVFTGLVGPDAFHNLMLVTSKWDQLGDLAGGVQREAELCERYWDFLIEKGSLTGRSYGDRQSALAIVRNIAFGRSASDMVSVPLALQKQMVDEHKSLEETSAGQALSQRIDHLKKDYDRQLMELKREHDLVNAQAQEDRRQMQAAIDHLRKGQLALSDEQFKLSNHSTISQQDNEVFTQYLKPQINVRIGMSEFLEADMPPPYSPPDPSQMSTRPASSRMSAFIVGAADTIIYSVNPVVESYRFLKPVVGKLFRPRLQEGYSRIEWKCSCGDILYGDYLERNPGSLRSLAAELGGRIISGPALNQAPANAQLPSPQTPAATHLKGASSGLSPSGSIGGPANIPRDGQSPTATGGQKASVVQQHGTGPKWLELCIPSTTGISSLVEIDTSGNCTDKMLFDAIRAQYHENKPSSRWLGRFAYRVMNGGGSVMVRICCKFLMQSTPPHVPGFNR
ncbi:hypothetical protein KCU64_g969, partial [Aureobasidium melanogenum]